jgi:hypothetical protein
LILIIQIYNYNLGLTLQSWIIRKSLTNISICIIKLE